MAALCVREPMPRYSGKRLIEERRIRLQYFANTLRVNLLALVQKTDDKYPWESEAWQEIYPNLSHFLNNTDSDFCGSDEEYFEIMKDYFELSKKDKWILISLHESHAKDLEKYVLPKPRTTKTMRPYFIGLGVGVLLGWLLF